MRSRSPVRRSTACRWSSTGPERPPRLVRQALYGAGRPPRKSGHVRQQGRHYDPPDESQRRQGAIRDRPRHCHAGRSAPGRRRTPRPVGSRRADAGNGAQHGRRPDRVRAGESQSRNLVRQRDGCPRGHHFRNGPFRLSEPGQQRARIPLYLPGGFGRAGDEDRRGDENRRRARARQAGQSYPFPTSWPPHTTTTTSLSVAST